MDTAQVYQKLLTDAIRKQMIILGPQITFLKVHNVPGLTVSEDGTVASLGVKPEETVTRFIEQFRDLSAPLVRKTMQPLLSAIGPMMNPAAQPQQTQQANQSSQQTQLATENSENQKIGNSEIQKI